MDVAEAALDDGEGGPGVYSVCGDGGDEVRARGRVGEDFGLDFVDDAHAVLEDHDCGVLREAAGDGAEGGDGVVGLGRDDEVPDRVRGDEGGSVGGEGVGDLGVEAGDGGLVAVGAEEADCAAGLLEREELGVVLEEERDRGGCGERPQGVRDHLADVADSEDVDPGLRVGLGVWRRRPRAVGAGGSGHGAGALLLRRRRGGPQWRQEESQR